MTKLQLVDEFGVRNISKDDGIAITTGLSDCINVGFDCYEGLIVNAQHVRDQATDAPETYDPGCWADTFANGYTRLLTRTHIDFACDNMPQFGEGRGDGKYYGGDTLPKGGGGGPTEVGSGGGRQEEQGRL